MLTASHLAFWTFVPCCVTPSSSPVSLSELLWTCHCEVCTEISIHFLTALEPKLQVSSIKTFQYWKDCCPQFPTFHPTSLRAPLLCLLASPELSTAQQLYDSQHTHNNHWLITNQMFLPIPKLSKAFPFCSSTLPLSQKNMVQKLIFSVLLEGREPDHLLATH